MSAPAVRSSLLLRSVSFGQSQRFMRRTQKRVNSCRQLRRFLSTALYRPGIYDAKTLCNTCRVRRPFILADDSIIYCFRINCRGERLSLLLREITLYSYIAYISAVCGWIYLILVSKWREEEGLLLSIILGGYRVGALNEGVNWVTSDDFLLEIISQLSSYCSITECIYYEILFEI